jgi:hypothetical protein
MISHRRFGLEHSAASIMLTCSQIFVVTVRMHGLCTHGQYDKHAGNGRKSLYKLDFLVISNLF